MSFSEIAALEERFQVATYKKMPVAVERGEGSWVYTSDGERYLDLYGGHAVASTGHCHPHVVGALRRQSDLMLFYSNLVYSEVRGRAAERLVSVAPDPLRKVFFCNSGTEANENAMRVARMATGRDNIISFEKGFHGRTADSISATFLGKYRDIGRPNVPGHLKAAFGDLASVESLLDSTTAAVMLEPIQSMGGVRMASPDFYIGLRKLTKSRGALLIYDEVQTGIGRTGDWFFAGSGPGGGAVPDLVTLAKGLGSGIPVGACLMTEDLGQRIHENDLGTTFGGGMLAMAAALATIEAVEKDDMLRNVRDVESQLRSDLGHIGGVSVVEGLGFLLGVRFREKAAPVHAALLERKIITGTSSDQNVLRLLPPLNLSHDQAGIFTKALGEILQ